MLLFIVEERWEAKEMNTVKKYWKKFRSNKNAVTIVGGLLILLVLIIGYNWRIDQVTKPVKVVSANEEISSRTKITADMLINIEVPPALVGENVIQDPGEIIDKYVNYNTTIPEGSLFYNGTLLDESQLPDAALIKIPEGEVAYNLIVDIDTSYANSIVPDSYIDIYFKAVDETETILIGKLVENVKILAIKSSSGKNVFEDVEVNDPHMYIFTIDEEVHLLLRQAEYLEGYDTELIPVPTGLSPDSKQGSVEIASQFIKTWITSKTVPIPEDVIIEFDEETDDEVEDDVPNDEVDEETVTE